MAFTLEKAGKVLDRIQALDLLDNLNSPHMREMFKRLKISAPVMIEALISADVMQRVKVGKYELTTTDPRSKQDLFFTLAKQIYEENAEAERRRKAEKDGTPVAEPRKPAQDPEPEPEGEDALKDRIAYLEAAVRILCKKAGIKRGAIASQLKLAGT